MVHVSELSTQVDDYTQQPSPKSRSDFLLYNVNNDYSANGSIVDQMGVIENQSSMVIKQHPRRQELEYALDDLLSTDPDEFMIVIEFGQRSAKEPEEEEVVFSPSPEPAVVLPPPTRPVYVTEKSIIIQ